MEQYILLLEEGTVCHDLEKNYLEFFQSLILSPFEETFIKTNARYAAPLAERRKYFFAIFNSAHKNHVIKWKEVTEYTLSKYHHPSLISHNYVSPEYGCEGEETSHITLQEAIHMFADQLPTCEFYNLDVIISLSTIQKLNEENDIETISALHRLSIWHGASIAIIVSRMICDSLLVKHWVEKLHANLIIIGETELSATLWRGSIQLGVDNNFSMPGFELKIICYDVLVAFPEEIPKLPLRVLPVINAIDACAISTIPFYMFSPVCFELILSQPHNLHTKSEMFLDMLRFRKGVAIILKMNLSSLEEPLLNQRHSTNAWRKAILSDNVKSPEFHLPKSTDHLFFAVTKCSTSSKVLAFLLCDPNYIRPNVFLHAVHRPSLQGHSTEEQEPQTECISIIKKIPFVRTSEFSLYLSLCDKLKETFFRLYPSSFMYEISSYNSMTTNWLTSLSRNIERNLNLNMHSFEFKMQNIMFEDVSSFDWPQRNFFHNTKILPNRESTQNNLLLQKKSQVHKKSKSDKFFIENIFNNFDVFGNAKQSTNMEPLRMKNAEKCDKSHQDFTKKKDKWPALLLCKHDDIYYNIDNAVEERQEELNKLTKRLVPHDTATTFDYNLLMNSVILNNSKKSHKRRFDDDF